MEFNLVSQITPAPMQSMRVCAEIVEWLRNPGNGIQVTADCMSYGEFANAVDHVIQELESLKAQARTKFDEFERR